MTIDEQKHILLQIKDDPQQFGIIFDSFYNQIFSYIFKRITDYDISRDIAADTFLKAFLNIQSFVWKDISISSWIYRIATNEINHHFRRNNNHNISLDTLFDKNDLNILNSYEFIDEKQSLERELELHEEFLKVQKCLTKLEIKYQEVLSLRYFEKKSIKEIAEILIKKEGTVKSLLSRGTEKLRFMINYAT
jgi:RNA polymerase sigma-70 factor, ECF subfamily